MEILAIKQKTEKLFNLLEQQKESILAELQSYESFATAVDEFERSLRCLRNIDLEIEYLTYGNVNTISAFFPLNLPLYSLMLFGVIPSFITNRIYIRPPLLMRSILQKIYFLLNLEEISPNIKIIELERQLFLDGYASGSDVILFTGKYENAKMVQKYCKVPLFIFNGAGINPIVITKSANIEFAVQKVIEMRLFNSGQDCAGPDAILIDQQVLKQFIKILFSQLKTIKIGDYSNRDIQVGKLIDDKHVLFIGKVFSRLKEKIIYGGTIDYKNSIVYPTVILDTLKDKFLNYQEFFAPVFYVLAFENIIELDYYFLNEEYLANAMYVSVFEESSKYTPRIKDSVILMNQIINDVEEGNKAYGGYGRKANFIFSGNKVVSKPILISEVISDHLKTF